MRDFKWIISLLLLMHIVVAAQDKIEGFGNLKIVMDSSKAADLTITSALLYRDVAIDYDTTAQLQDGDRPVFFFYPQLRDGHSNVLRLIVTDPQNPLKFYDIFFDLGDSLNPVMRPENKDSMVYIGINGMLSEQTNYSSHLKGEFNLNLSDVENEVSGSVRAEFDYPLFLNGETLNHISLEGEFDVPVGKFREASIATAQPSAEQKARYRRNLIIAALLSAALIAIFGLK